MDFSCCPVHVLAQGLLCLLQAMNLGLAFLFIYLLLFCFFYVQGKISFVNLKRVAKELGENLTDEELQVFMVVLHKMCRPGLHEVGCTSLPVGWGQLQYHITNVWYYEWMHTRTSLSFTLLF